MANQNFRVKKGLEVGLGGTYLYADDNGVGINSTAPRELLDVRGTGKFDQLEVGPGTSLVGVGSTYFKVDGDSLFDGDVRITGDLIFDDAVIDDLFVAGIATINEIDFKVGYGESLGVGVLTANTLEVTGLSTFESAVVIDAPLGVTSSVGIAKSLFVGGGAVIGGGVTFEGDIGIDIEVNVELEGNINQNSGIATFDELKFNVGVGSTLTVDELSVTGVASINGAGIATIGGDPEFNSLSVTGFSTFGGLNTTGFSTFYQNVRIEEDLEVGGDITLLDLDAGNISVAGTVYTNGLDFNSGVGTELSVGFGSIGIATVGELNVTGFATFGGLNTTGFSTFYQNLRVDKDLVVGGDIQLEDLESGNISVGGTITTNGLEFNVGIGTSLTITGISSLGVITGIGSELQYLPAGSISTSVGIGSTIPPTTRPTGEPIQPGDLWFDADGLRQYTYFVGLNTLGVYEGRWIDSNPPPIQPDLTFEADFGPAGSIDIAREALKITGTENEIFTSILPVGGANTVTVGLTTDVTIKGDLSLPLGFVTGLGVSFTGIGTFDRLEANSAEIDSVVIGDITVGDIAVGEVGIDTLRFNVGFGTSLTISENLQISGIASRDGAALVAQGDAVGFASAVIAGITTLGTTSPTLGFTTVLSDLYVGGDLYVADDINLDEASLRELEVSGRAGINTLEFGVGIGSTLTLKNEIGIGGSIGVGGNAFLDGEVIVGGGITITGIASIGGNIEGNGNIDISGNIDANQVSADRLVARDTYSLKVGTAETISVTRNLESFGEASFSGITTFTNAAGFKTAYINESLEVVGLSSFAGDIAFSTAKGYELTIDRLLVPSDGFVDLPGIPVVGGAASFSQLNVTGLATFIGFSTFIGDVLVSGAMTVGSLTADEINFSGGTGIGTDSIETDKLNVTGVSTFAGLSTFKGDVFVADDLEVKRNLLVGGIATVGILTVNTSATIKDLVITGDLKGASGDAIIVDGDGVITGVVTIGSNSITLDGRAGQEYIEIGTGSGNVIAGVNTTTGERSYISIDEGRFNNFISVAGVGSTSTFANDVVISGNLTLEGDVDFDGGTGIGSTSITSGDINADTITVGFITATNAQVAGIITAQDFNSLSDKRVKENIEPIVDPLDKVSRLNGVTYQFVNSGKPSVGVIAQEVEKVFPELIAGTFPKSVNYNGLTGLLIEAVKELKEQNEELKRRLDKLEG